MNLKQYDLECIWTAKEMLVKNLQRHIIISDLALEVGLNEHKLKYGFKQVFGMGVYTYLVHARMQKARTLLEETDKSIKEIASLTGYKRTSSFIRSFKKEFSKSPAMWRKVNTGILLWFIFLLAIPFRIF